MAFSVGWTPILSSSRPFSEKATALDDDSGAFISDIGV